jgi:sterol desaturase/sphingolipid hydroxylase (fatty acid hydroxylase superfamily)
MTLAQLQVASPIIIVSAGLMFIGLERLFPYNPGQRVFRDGFWTDLLGYGVVQSYVMGVVISSLIYFVDNHTHASRLHVVSHWPIWVQVLFFLVWHDLNTYLIHRCQHRSKYLWRTHEAHHATEQVDWLSGIRSHSLEILLYETAQFLPVILLGAAPEVPLYKGMINSIYGMYIHSNLNWRMGKLLYILNGPELHRWHHANDDPEAYDHNYATKLALWDWLFGTIYRPKSTAVRYGYTAAEFPKSYVRQHLHAFRRFEKQNDRPQSVGEPASAQ